MKIYVILLLVILSFNKFAQESTFSASWISAEDIELKEHNVIHLRKTIELDKVQGEIVVPENMETTFYWNGKSQKLITGENKISF